AERARLQASAVEPLAAPSEWFSEFRDWDAIEARMDELAAQQPDLVTVEPVGPSIEGREIRALRLLSPATTDKAAMLVSGTQHAREWLSPMSVMCVAEAMVEGYGTDPATTALLDAVELLLVPVVNPDGYVYSWQAERYWRKNRRGDYGVDLNRNWSHAWGGEGASNYPYDENFRGDGPLSEPETSALAELVEAQPHLVAHVDVHAFGELVLHPWGHQYGPAPDEAMLSALAGQMAGAIEATHGHAYLPIQGSDLYVASGVLDDWSYGQRGMMAFTIELRGNDFVVPPAEIVPACEETLAAVWVLAQWASEQSEPLPVPGDDTTGGGSSSDGTSGEGPLPGDTSPPGEGSTTGVPDGTTGGPGDASSGSPPGGADPEPASGCGCGQRAPAGGGAWLLALLGLGLRLRRRRLERERVRERVRGDQ
ncbi:MAG: hypothetical protein KDK70_19160, partial [Myxococcales bacterium]|nr:hypothetical protein [Myxococcales bacterium]